MKFKLMISCKEAAHLLSDRLEAPLPIYKRILLKMHVTMCDACARYGKQIIGLKKLMAKKNMSTEEDDQFLSHENLSGEARKRIKLFIQKKGPIK